MELTGKQRRHLRALGHSLLPATQIGKEGLSESLLAAVDTALEARELVKVRIGRNAPGERDVAARELAEKTRSEVAQVLGKTILLYRRNAEAPKISLPPAKPE